MHRRSLTAGLGLALAGGGLIAAAPAQAAFPGENGEIAFARTFVDVVDPGPPVLAGLRRELRTIDPATGQQRLIAEGEAVAEPNAPTAGTRSGQILSTPEFSPEGTMLVTNAYATTQPDEGLVSSGFLGLVLPFGQNIKVYDAQSTTERCTYVGAVNAGIPHYDGGRGQILLSRAPDASLAPYYDGAPERVDAACNPVAPNPSPTPLNSQFAVSPDGNRIVVGQNLTPPLPPMEFAVRGIDGSGATPPFMLGMFGVYPDWTPDGSEIVYGFTDAMESGIKALDPSTGVIREIVTDSDPDVGHLPAVSPDGTKIVYARAVPDMDGNPQSSLLVVDSSRDANDPTAPSPTVLTSPSGSLLNLDLQPDWGPKPPPGPAPPPPAPLPGLPPGPTSASPVCNPVPERNESEKGTIRYTRTALKIQQNIDSAVIRRLNAANVWMDAGIVPTDLCAGAFGPGAFQAGIAFAGGAPHQATPPTPRDTRIIRRPGTGTITRSRRQLEINENISRALRARAVATVKRIEALTGGNLAPGASLSGRAVWPGLQAVGPKPPSTDAPATELEIGRLPRKIPIRPNASTARKQQQRSQGSIILANRALDAIAGGLTEANFQPGSIGSAHI